LSRFGASKYLAVLALLGICCAAAVSFVSAADLPSNVEMLLMPGTDKSIPMPPASMRKKIEARMKRGDVPNVILVAGGDIERKCRTEGYLLGCVTETSCKLGLVYVRKGLSREVEHMARVHELAHCLYGWKH
jgi:hypothetical protein